MILYFNKNGQLLEKLEYGSSPRTGATDFQIFAYFEGLEDYNIATIRFRRPDLVGSEYPDLFMLKKNDFVYNPEIQYSKYFKASHGPYSGFIFNFNNVMDGTEHIRLLDTHGMWEASITLYPSAMVNDGSSVMGLVKFNVEKAVSSDDEEAQEAGLNVVINNIRQLLEQITAGVETSGATNTTDKIFLIGAKEQAQAIKTYSNEHLYYQENRNGGLHANAPTITIDKNHGQLELKNENFSTYYNAEGVLLAGTIKPNVSGGVLYKYPLGQENLNTLGEFVFATQEWTEANVNDMLNTANSNDIDNLFS